MKISTTKTTKRQEQKGVIEVKLIIIGLLVIVALVVGLVIKNQNGEKTETTNHKTPSKTAQKSLKPIGVAATVSGGTLTLKEFGVSVPLSDDLKGLEYSTITNPQKTMTVYNLRLKDYTALANKCLSAPDGTPQSFATLTKTNSQYSTADQEHRITLLKQFKDFYIGSMDGSISNLTTCKDPAVAQQLKDSTDQLLSSLKNSFANAKQL